MIIVKIGGGKKINIEGIIADLAGVDEPFVIVHGANALRDKLAEDLGQPKQVLTSVKGYTSVYSDEKLLDVMMMAYAGLRNKRIVELCQRHGTRMTRSVSVARVAVDCPEITTTLSPGASPNRFAERSSASLMTSQASDRISVTTDSVPQLRESWRTARGSGEKERIRVAGRKRFTDRTV